MKFFLLHTMALKKTTVNPSIIEGLTVVIFCFGICRRKLPFQFVSTDFKTAGIVKGILMPFYNI